MPLFSQETTYGSQRSQTAWLPLLRHYLIILPPHRQIWVNPNPRDDNGTEAATDTKREQRYKWRCAAKRLYAVWVGEIRQRLGDKGRKWCTATGGNLGIKAISSPLRWCSPGSWWGSCGLYSWKYRVWSDCWRLWNLLLLRCLLHSARWEQLVKINQIWL